MAPRPTHLHIAIAAIIAGMFAGCATKPVDQVHPVWPAPPAEARVKHVKNVRAPGDLVASSMLDRFINLLTGRAAEVSLIRPNCAAIDGSRRLYVTDQERQGVVVFDLGSSKADLIARAGDTYFVSPVGVAVCGDMIAVADSALGAVYVLTPKGKLIKTLKREGGFQRPTGLAWSVDEGVLYVVDTLANEVCVFNLDSGELVRRFGTHGAGPGQFNYPTHIFIDATGTVYITDSLNFRVQILDGRGTFIGHIGKLGDASGHLAVPKGLVVDSHGYIYVVDSYFSTVQVFDRKGRFLLGIGEPGEKTGQFQVPTGLAIDSADRIYVCDSYNRRLQILQYIGETSEDHSDTAP